MVQVRCVRKSINFAGGIAALLLAATSPLKAQPAPTLPAGDGRDILATACNQCHGLGTIVSMRDGEGGWRAQVRNMILRGAQVNGSEFEVLIHYLATNFGPGSPRPGPQATPVALPDGNGRELVEARCQLCHDLNRVAGIKRSQVAWDAIVANMVRRGATAAPDEAKTISAYLGSHFAAAE